MLFGAGEKKHVHVLGGVANSIEPFMWIGDVACC